LDKLKSGQRQDKSTKIPLAFFTTLGSMFFMLSKMRKPSRG
jgi:hypothetical protein